MLELMGRGYVIEHCVTTLNSLRKEDNYRAYLTDVLRVIAKGVGYEIKMRYADLLSASNGDTETEKSSEEIIETIKQKAEVISSGRDDPRCETDT